MHPNEEDLLEKKAFENQVQKEKYLISTYLKCSSGSDSGPYGSIRGKIAEKSLYFIFCVTFSPSWYI